MRVRARPQLPPPGVPLRRPLHPGAFLARTVLGPLGVSQSDAARVLGISRRRMHELVHGERAMSADTALRCAAAWQVSASVLLELQARWECFHGWQLQRARAALGSASPNV